MFAGHSWQAWPIFGNGGAERTAETVTGGEGDPPVSWTHVVDSEAFSGPVAGYLPEFFTRRYEQWCAMRATEDSTYEWDFDPATQR